MKVWKKETQNIGLIYFSLCCLIYLCGIFSLRAEQMSEIKYLAEFKTRESACMVRINGFPLVDNFDTSSGTMTTDLNATAFLANGKNSIELLMGAMDPNDDKTLHADSSCTLVITQDTQDTSKPVTSIQLAVDKDRKINASSSLNYLGESSETAIDEQQLPSDDELQMHRSARSVILDHIPAWQWVSAKPVTDRDIPEIKSAYTAIWSAMNSRDIDALKKLAEISNKEMGLAEGISPDAIFESYDLPQNILDKTLSPIPLTWEKYVLKSYCGGRVFRFIKGINQNSPLRLMNQEKRIVYSYNPYFSIIDGKVVIVR
jgi:hypothetical protein